MVEPNGPILFLITCAFSKTQILEFFPGPPLLFRFFEIADGNNFMVTLLFCKLIFGIKFEPYRIYFSSVSAQTSSWLTDWAMMDDR